MLLIHKSGLIHDHSHERKQIQQGGIKIGVQKVKAPSFLRALLLVKEVILGLLLLIRSLGYVFTITTVWLNNEENSVENRSK